MHYVNSYMLYDGTASTSLAKYTKINCVAKIT